VKKIHKEICDVYNNSMMLLGCLNKYTIKTGMEPKTAKTKKYILNL
jgi:hypothetical protein